MQRKILSLGLALGWIVPVLAGSPAPPDAARPCLAAAGAVTLDGVEGRLDHLAADPGSRRLFVAALENHTVEVIDLAARQRLPPVTGVLEPQGLGFVPRAGRLLICSRGDGTCRSCDAATRAAGPWLDLGRNADNVRYDARSATVYVGSGGEPGPGLISAIDLAALLPVAQGGMAAPPRSPADLLPDRPRQADARAQVELPAHPESFQIDPERQRIYVNVPDEHLIAVVAARSNGLVVVTNWPVTVAARNFPLALDAGASRLFAVCRQPPCIATYDTRSGALFSRAPCVGDADDAFYDAPARRLYVIGGEGFVDVFQAPEAGGDLIRIERCATRPRARTGLFVPELRLLAVAAPHTADGPAAVLLFRVGP